MNPGRKTLFAVAAVFLFAGLITGVYFLAREKPVYETRRVSVAGNEAPVYYVKTGEKAVALTFDLSWGTRMPPKVLSVLDKYGVKSTFFLSGPWAKKHGAVVTSIVEAGHELASHGDAHVNLSNYGKTDIEKNISQAHEAIKSVSGMDAKFLRPPNGDFDDVVLSTAAELGYETIIWSVDSLDWKNPGVDYIINRVNKEVFPGAIVLFHASDTCEQTDLALPAVIENLQSQGYKLVTLGELAKMGDFGRDDPRGNPYFPGRQQKTNEYPGGEGNN